MEKPTQSSMLAPDGRPDGGVVGQNRLHDLENTFKTPQQRARAQEIINSGQAASAAEALSIMSKEDSENPVNDAFQK